MCKFAGYVISFDVNVGYQSIKDGIMGIFNFGFFGTQEHRVFNYRPRYYDEEKDALKQKFGAVDGSRENNYVPGAYIKGSLRNGNYSKTRGSSKAQRIIGMVTLILAFVVIYLIAKYYSLLFA